MSSSLVGVRRDEMIDERRLATKKKCNNNYDVDEFDIIQVVSQMICPSFLGSSCPTEFFIHPLLIDFIS